MSFWELVKLHELSPPLVYPTVLLVAIWRVTEPRPRASAARRGLGAMSERLAQSIIRWADSREEMIIREVAQSSMDYLVKFKWRKQGEMEKRFVFCTWNCNLKSWMLADEHQHLHFVRVVWNQGCRVLGTICIGLHSSTSLANFRPKNKPIETKTI